MGKLSVGQASLEGVRLIGRRPGSVLGWTLAYFLLALLPSAGIARLEMGAGASQASFLDAARLLLGALPWVSLAAWAIIYAAIYRSVLRPEQGRAPFMGLGPPELRQLLLVLIGNVLLFLLAQVGKFALGVILGVGAALPQPLGWAFWLLGSVAILLGGMALWARLAMASPMALSQDRFRFFSSWRFTRGRTRALTGLLALAILMALATLVFVGVTLFGLLEVVAGMLRWRADQLASALSRPLQPADSPWVIGLGLAWSLVAVTVQTVAVAPWARAYQVLAGTPATRPSPLPARAVAFGPLPAGARLGPAWTAPVILVLAMSLGMGLLTFGLLIVVRSFSVTTQALGGWLGDLGMSVGFDLLVVVLLLAWVVRVERRTLASAGFGGRVSFGDIGWFVGGAIWAFLLALGLGAAIQMVAVAAASPQSTVDAISLPAQALAQAPAVLAVIVLLAFSEEVMFRGWLLSATAPRTGMPAAIAISSFLFAAFHVLPWELLDPARLISFLSYAAIGAGFAAVALGRRQIWSSTALHAGYNSFLAFATMAAQHATPQKLWGSVSEQRRGSTDADEAMMMLGLNLAIAAVLIGVLLMAKRRRAAGLAAAAPARA